MILFKRKQIKNPVHEFHSEVLEKAFQKPKSGNDLVDEIHETFFTEVDRLLAEAKISISTETNMEELISKAHRLKELGFKRASGISEATSEIERLQVIEQTNFEKKNLIAAIRYFSDKYPQYKFITLESINKICEKYGLYFSEAELYTGAIPDENLLHIEKFRVDAEDNCYNSVCHKFSWSRDPEKISYSTAEHRRKDYDYSITKEPYYIAAPKHDFLLEDTELKGNQIVKKQVVKDPVVFKPVFYGEKLYYLIVTAWGKEASDELVVNEKMN